MEEQIQNSKNPKERLRIDNILYGSTLNYTSLETDLEKNVMPSLAKMELQRILKGNYFTKDLKQNLFMIGHRIIPLLKVFLDFDTPMSFQFATNKCLTYEDLVEKIIKHVKDPKEFFHFPFIPSLMLLLLGLYTNYPQKGFDIEGIEYTRLGAENYYKRMDEEGLRILLQNISPSSLYGYAKTKDEIERLQTQRENEAVISMMISEIFEFFREIDSLTLKYSDNTPNNLYGEVKQLFESMLKSIEECRFSPNEKRQKIYIPKIYENPKSPDNLESESILEHFQIHEDKVFYFQLQGGRFIILDKF